MNAVGTLFRHCEAKLEMSSMLSQLGITASPKQSHRTEFVGEMFSNRWKISDLLSSARRLLRRELVANHLLNFASFFSATPRNDECGRSASFFTTKLVVQSFSKGIYPLAKVNCQQVLNRNIFGGVKRNLLEGSL